jgi:protein phosphatase
MERIAVISDIHGNVPALQAVDSDLRVRGITRIFCLGDLVGKGPQPELVVDWVQARCEVVVQGNWDDFIGKPTRKTELLWHQRRLGPERLTYLAKLPFSFDFFMSGKAVRLFHASPESVYARIQPWDEPERRLTMFGDSMMTGPAPYGRLPDVVGYGDVHNAFVQHFPGKMLFNTGSVGNPLEIPQASYAILEGDCGSREPGTFAVTLVRVPYDVEEAVRIATDARMPLLEPYVKELRTGRFRGRS